MNLLDKIFEDSFLKEYEKKEQRKALLNKEERFIALKKQEQLEPIKKFLQKFTDIGVIVQNTNKFNQTVIFNSSQNSFEPQPFDFYDMDSSKSLSPGISIWFDHPAQVEIAIPNNIAQEGVVVIKVASNHPDAHILENIFFSMETACHALAKFIGKNTVSIQKKDKINLNK